MASTTWKEIAELLGIAAIVASLIFVGLQMKQSQEIAIAAQYETLKRAVRNSRSPVLPVLENSQTQFRASFVVLINQIAKGSDDQL